jgi:hypothetical protein
MRQLPQPHGAVAAIKAREFAEKEWGSAGETAASASEPSSTKVTPPLIPPPPWSENYRPEDDPDHEPAIEPLAEEEQP